MEEAIKFLVRLRLSESDRKKALKALDGGDIERHIELLRQRAGLDTTPFQSPLDQLLALVQLRNVIVHSGGHLGDPSRPEKLTQAIDRLQAEARAHNYDLFGEDDDGYLVAGGDLVAHSHVVVEHVLNPMFATVHGARIWW